MESESFRVEVDNEGSGAGGSRGSLDLATAPELEAVIDQHPAGRAALVVDLGQLDLVDSTGLRLMLQLQGREDGTLVRFLGPGEPVARLLDLTDVRDRLR
jgi:anti-anti-sigma factor